MSRFTDIQLWDFSCHSNVVEVNSISLMHWVDTIWGATCKIWPQFKGSSRNIGLGCSIPFVSHLWPSLLAAVSSVSHGATSHYLTGVHLEHDLLASGFSSAGLSSAQWTWLDTRMGLKTEKSWDSMKRVLWWVNETIVLLSVQSGIIRQDGFGLEWVNMLTSVDIVNNKEKT